VIVRIGDATISRAALDHWLTVANDSPQAQTGRRAPPLPLPPNFTACIERHQSKATCRLNYRTLVTEVLDFLIPELWIQGEAAARGLSVTPEEVNAAYEQERRNSSPSLVTSTELRSFLAASGQTVADLKWRTMVNVLANKLQRQAVGHEPQLSQHLDAKWQPRTQCRPGYAVSYCSTVAVPMVPQGSWVPATMSIVPPPSRPQRLRFVPTTKRRPPTGRLPTIVTPKTGPLSTEPTITTPSGPPPDTLVIKDLITGEGAVARAGDMITVNYVGALYSNGTVFDSTWSRKQTFSTPLGEGAVIRGWDEGLVGMRVGGRRELIIPPSLAYGKSGSGPIPGNATLVYIVDLLSLQPPSGATGVTGATTAPGALG
jgi:peptidylprolyl isomerase